MTRVRPAVRCRARRSDGQPCRAFAMVDAVVCKAHGGATPQARRKAKERAAERRVARLAGRYAQDNDEVQEPLTALLKLAGEITGFKDFLADRIAEMSADAWRYKGEHAEQLRAEVALYERALDRTARVLVDINKLGLEARVVTLYEQMAAGLMRALDRVLVDLDVPAEARQRAPETWAKHLQLLTEARETP